MKQRVMVLRLWRGGYLDRRGLATPSMAEAAKLRTPDMLRLKAEMQSRDYSDIFYGASSEVLRKRGTHVAMSPEEAERFRALLKLRRVQAEADKYDRLAVGFLAQAKSAEDMAQQMRDKATSIRQALQSSAEER